MTGISTQLSGSHSLPQSSRVTLTDCSTTDTVGLGYVLSNSSLRFIFQFYVYQSLDCSFTFFLGHCVFQDLYPGKRIARGVEYGGLYYFVNGELPTSNALQSSLSPYEHHYCLGHPSLQNLKQLVSPCCRLESLPCEVCEFSKHRYVSFYLKVENRLSRPFHFVHLDIWGPICVPSHNGFKYCHLWWMTNLGLLMFIL